MLYITAVQKITKMTPTEIQITKNIQDITPMMIVCIDIQSIMKLSM